MMNDNVVFDHGSGSFVEISDQKDMARMAPQIAPTYGGITRSGDLRTPTMVMKPRSVGMSLLVDVPVTGRRADRIAAAAPERMAKTTFSAGDGTLPPCQTLPVRRAQLKRPAGMSARQFKKQQRAERRGEE